MLIGRLDLVGVMRLVILLMVLVGVLRVVR